MPAQNTYNKSEILISIFNKKTENGTKHIGKDIAFTLPDLHQAFDDKGYNRPTSTSNFVLDLTRKNRGIEVRLPREIIDYGYDLRKKTGPVSGQKENYCGEFIYLGKGINGETLELSDWLVWSQPDEEITIKNIVPDFIYPYLANDEGSIFSVIDYCDILSLAVLGKPKTIFRVQNPMKWQPNEIDGFYISNINNRITVYPVETKASSTDDDINLVQLNGQYNTFINRMQNQQMKQAVIRPLAVKMVNGGLNVAVLEKNSFYDPISNKGAPYFIVHKQIRVNFDSKIPSWK